MNSFTNNEMTMLLEAKNLELFLKQFSNQLLRFLLEIFFHMSNVSYVIYVNIKSVFLSYFKMFNNILKITILLNYLKKWQQFTCVDSVNHLWNMCTMKKKSCVDFKSFLHQNILSILFFHKHSKYLQTKFLFLQINNKNYF